MLADFGANPYRVPPAAFAGDPLLEFNFWTGITSPYGPLWTTISAALVAVVGAAPLRVSLAFKGIAALSALVFAAIVYRLAERVRADSGLPAFVLVGWHPLQIIESAGTGHYDAAVMALALLGLLMLVRGRARPALLLLAASALLKYTTLPLLVLVALARLRLQGWRRIAGHCGVDALAITIPVALIVAPYWAGGRMLDAVRAEPARLFSNPAYFRLAYFVADHWGSAATATFRDTLRPAAQVAVASTVLASLLWLGHRVWRDRPVGAELLQVQLRAWAAVTIALSLLPANAHPWYTIWALGPVAALSGGRGRPLAAYFAFIALSFIVYHTAVGRG